MLPSRAKKRVCRAGAPRHSGKHISRLRPQRPRKILMAGDTNRYNRPRVCFGRATAFFFPGRQECPAPRLRLRRDFKLGPGHHLGRAGEHPSSFAASPAGNLGGRAALIASIEPARRSLAGTNCTLPKLTQHERQDPASSSTFFMAFSLPTFHRQCPTALSLWPGNS